jgi:hypothetical protein
MLSLDNFGLRSLYPPPLATLAVCRRRREAADLGREHPSEIDRGSAVRIGRCQALRLSRQVAAPDRPTTGRGAECQQIRSANLDMTIFVRIV